MASQSHDFVANVPILDTKVVPDELGQLDRPAELAELVWDHFGVQNGIIGLEIMNLWCTFGPKTSDTYEKSEKLWFWSRKSEILVPKGVNLEGFLTVLREKSMKMLIFDEILWNLNDFFDQKRRTRVKKWKLSIFDRKW